MPTRPPKLSASDRALVERTIRTLRRRPEHLNMSDWIEHEPTTPATPTTPEPWCGTAACLAGFLAIEATGELPRGLVEGTRTDVDYDQDQLPRPLLRRILKRFHLLDTETVTPMMIAMTVLGVATELLAVTLFVTPDWPDKFQEAYHARDIDDDRGRVRVVVARLRHYLKTGA